MTKDLALDIITLAITHAVSEHVEFEICVLVS